MKRSHTVDQLLAQIEHPEWSSTQGRVLDEARHTFLALAEGKTPQTVLGGLVLNGQFDYGSTVEGRTIGHMAAVTHTDPTMINHRGDAYRDVLADLIEVGWVERVESEIDMLDYPRPGGEHFRLLLPIEITSVN